MAHFFVDTVWEVQNRREQGVSDVNSKHDLGSIVELKKLANQLLSAFCEASETSTRIIGVYTG